MPISLAAGALLTMVLATQSSQPMHITPVDKGGQSNIEQAEKVVARTPAEWSALWRRHATDRPMPKIDFSQSMVVGVFLGSRPTGGYTVEITSVEPDGTGLIVNYREQRPAKDMMTTQVITMPFALVSVPRVEGEVKFKPAS